MATTTNTTLTVTFGYTGTDFTRSYKMNVVDAEIVVPHIKRKILEYNAAIPAVDKKVFISDDYDASDPQNIIGKFSGIIAAKYTTDVETDINLNE